jgi:hypothetical protein
MRNQVRTGSLLRREFASASRKDVCIVPQGRHRLSPVWFRCYLQFMHYAEDEVRCVSAGPTYSLPNRLLKKAL